MKRRDLLKASAASSVLALPALTLPRLTMAAENPPAPTGLPYTIDETALIYLTPLHRDGVESSCQAEVWFVHQGGEVMVVTASDAWRARAISKGLTRARIWIGDVGVWNSDARYKTLPTVEMTGDTITDKTMQADVLERFGDKYSLEWIVWGSRFRKGLADGSRVMLRYRLS